MANILLGTNNRADAATLNDGSWTNLNNVKSANFGLQAVSASAAASATKFRVDLGGNYVVRALALANCIMGKDALWRVRMGTSPFDVDFSTGGGDTRLTASGGANGLVFNESGVQVAASTQPRFNYDRLGYWNGFKYSDDISNVVWQVGNARVIDTNTIVFGTGQGQFGQSGLNVLAGNTYVITGKVRLASGTDGGYRPYLYNGTTTQYSDTMLTATSKWQRFRAVIVAASSALTGLGSAGLHRGATGDPSPTTSAAFQIKGLQIQSIPGGDFGEELGYRATTSTRVHRCLGILREEARTNLLLWSDDFSNAAWTKGNATVTVNQAVGPSGAADMDLIKEDNTTNFHQVYQAVTLSASTYYYVGCVAERAVGTRDLQMVLAIDATGDSMSAVFNLSTGVASSVTAAGSNPFTNVIAGTLPLGDGLFWCWLVGRNGASSGTSRAVYRLWNATSSYLGDNASGIYLCCANLQTGSVPTSAIPTTSATVTRTADSITATGGNFSSWYTSITAGTIYTEVSRQFDHADGAAAPVAASITDGTAANRMLLYSVASSDSANAIVTSVTVPQATFSANSQITYDSVPARMAMAYRSNDAAFCANGGTVSTDASIAIPGVFDRLEIGGAPTSAGWNGHIRRFAYWPWRLTNSELQLITADGPGAIPTEYDSGWLLARQMEFTDDEVPANWAAQYNPMLVTDARTLRYGTVEFLDTAAISIGRLFISGGFQPNTGAAYGLKDGRADLSTSTKSLSGKKYSTARRRLRNADFALNWLTQTEADTLHELQGAVGTTDEVLFVPDPNDMAFSQRYGGIGTLSELSPIDYPYVLTRAVPIRWEEKL